jgi:hypothetical protein
MVAGGKLTPEEGRFMQDEIEHKGDVMSLLCNDNDDDSECSDDSDDDNDNDDCEDNGSVVSIFTSVSSTAKEGHHDSWNLEMMNEILNSLTKPNQAPLAW